MRGLGLAIGSKVLMMRRGGVIPNLERVVKEGKGTIEIPKCAFLWSSNGDKG